MAFATIPGVEEIGEALVGKTCDLAHDGQAHQATEPGVARRTQPDLDGAIGADEEPALGVDRVQPAAYVFNPGAKARENVRFEIDIAELDGAGAGRAHEPAALTVDPAVTDRAFGGRQPQA